MKNIAKKLVIYSMVAIMQFGLGATISEASARHDDNRQPQQRYEDNQRGHRDNGNVRQDQRRAEATRHEREMQRRDQESERAWHERQRCENERHDQRLNVIETATLVYLLLNS